MDQKQNKMDCSYVRNNLFSHGEKQLSDKEMNEFEDHLRSCRECSRIVSDFHSVLLLIDKKKTVEVNPYASTRILQKIESRMESAGSKPGLFFQRYLQPVTLSFFLLIAVAIGFSVVKQKVTRYSEGITHQKDLQLMKSELNIPVFVDESNTFFDNH
jgi:hypothetical protein